MIKNHFCIQIMKSFHFQKLRQSDSILLLCTLFELNCFGRQIKKDKLQGGEISSNHNSGWEVSSPLEWNVSFGKSLISYVDAPSSISQSLLKYLTQYLQSSIVKDIDSNEPNNLRGCQILDTQNFTQNILLAPPSKLKTSVRQWKWRKTK